MPTKLRRLLVRVEPDLLAMVADLAAAWSPYEPLLPSAVVRIALSRCEEVESDPDALPRPARPRKAGPKTARLPLVIRPQSEPHLKRLAAAWSPWEPLSESAVIRQAIVRCYQAQPERPGATAQPRPR